MSSYSEPLVLITRQEIDTTVRRLVEEIRKDYQGKNPILIGILKGSFVFMADLARQLDFPLEVEFVRLSSYCHGTVSQGKIKVVQSLHCSIKGRHILVVEDIVDSGLTTAFLLDYLSKKKPASLKLCALLDKPARRKVPVTIDYIGHTVPDKFLVGYGLDWDEKYRYLPDVCSIEEEK